MRPTFVLAFMSMLAVAAPARADIDKCQQGIAKAVGKLDGKMLKGFQKCTDLYRKARAKGTSIADAAATCQLQLVKTITFPDPGSPPSSMAAAKVALDQLTSVGTCDDDDLRALGHLPTIPFGDTWARAQIVARLGGVYDAAVSLTRDTGSIFRALAGAGGCPMCSTLLTAPCAIHSCRLAPGTGSVEVRTGVGPPLTTPALSGQLTFSLCRADNVLPGDYVISGGASKTLKLGSVLGATACLTVGTTRGYITCGASAPRVATTTCRDHSVATPETDDCAAAGFTNCTAAHADLIDGDPSGALNTHVGAQNGGECLTFATSPAAAGDGVVVAPVTMKLVRATQVGPDTIACTDDDTAPAGFLLTVPLTTYTSQATLHDANDVAGSTLTSPVMLGSPFSCNNLAEGSLALGKLVGAVPALHGVCTSAPCDDPHTVADEGSIPSDGTMGFTLTCQ